MSKTFFTPHKTSILVSCLLIIIVFSACTTHTPIEPTEPIQVGAIFMLTGFGATYGENSLMGAELAREEINAEGGINGRPLEIIYEDNQGDDPATTITVFRNLVSRDIEIIIGPHWSRSGVAVAPIACDENVLMLSPTVGSATFNEECDSLFTLWPHDVLMSEALGQHIYDQGHRRLAILGMNGVWEIDQADAVRKGFENAGGTIVTYELPPQDTKNFHTEVLKIKQESPDAVFIQYTYQDIVARQLRETGVLAPLFGVLTDHDRVTNAQGALEGATIVTANTPTVEFQEKFQARYGVAPGVSADVSYDAVILLAKAMRETESTDITVLKKYLSAQTTYNGGSGTLAFDSQRSVTKPFIYATVKDDQIATLQ